MRHIHVFAALLLASVVIKVPEALAFIALYQGSCGGGPAHRLSQMILKDGNIEASNIEDLILSLSMEPTDESRREKLKSIFENIYHKETPEKANIFASQFNQAMITTGDRVQLQAANAARSKAGDDGINTQGNAEPLLIGQKSDTERQLWALVDMMVQSKIIIKKASVANE